MMGSRLKDFLQVLKRIGFYIPFTAYFSLFFIAVLIGYKWLKGQAGIPDSSYSDIFNLLMRFSFYFCSAILIFGLLSVSAPFVYFIWKKKNTGIDFTISIPETQNSQQSKQTIRFNIHPILRPLLGFVKIRLKYDKAQFSEKFLLIRQSRKKFIETRYEGEYLWTLPEIKEYLVEEVVIYFEDYFQFFSLAMPLNTYSAFHVRPEESFLSKNLKVAPRKTEETSTRIEELKKVEGEFLNYKNFENNDDVRRIVWKIYAKNKELVVRIPEVLDPYASHIYLYISFFSGFNVKGNKVIEVPFLNNYKTMCWAVYQQLKQKGFEVRYAPDQDIPSNSLSSETEQIKYSISVCSWQMEKGLKDYVRPKDASIVIISSLSDVSEVRNLIEEHGNEISFVFVPLSESFNSQHIGDWLQWLFIQQEKDDMAVYKTSWNISLIRLKVLNNEKELVRLLEQYERSTVLKKALS